MRPTIAKVIGMANDLTMRTITPTTIPTITPTATPTTLR